MTTSAQPQIDWSRPVEPVPEWARELAARLGYPEDIPLVRRIPDEQRHWIRGDTEEDYGAWKFDITGTPIHALPEAPNEPPDVFAYGYRPSRDGPLLWIRTIVTRLHLPDSAVFLERTYRADGTFREDICGVNTCERDGMTFVRMMKDVEKALEVLDVMFPQGGPGRPLGSGYVTTPEHFRSRIFPIIQQLARQGTKRPRQKQVCKAISAEWPEYQITRAKQESECEPRQLHRWLKENGWTDWKAVVDDALNAD